MWVNGLVVHCNKQKDEFDTKVPWLMLRIEIEPRFLKPVTLILAFRNGPAITMT